jgi:hypothetical protein
VQRAQFRFVEPCFGGQGRTLLEPA